MCTPRAPSPPPAPEPIPTPTQVSPNQQNAPASAVKRNEDGEAVGRSLNRATTAERKRLGRGSLRIPLASVSGGSGLNFPTS